MATRVVGASNNERRQGATATTPSMRNLHLTVGKQEQKKVTNQRFAYYDASACVESVGSFLRIPDFLLVTVNSTTSEGYSRS